MAPIKIEICAQSDILVKNPNIINITPNKFINIQLIQDAAFN
jgi:hypothetical protein